MGFWKREHSGDSRFLNLQDIKRYSSFAPLTLLPLLVSILVLPVTIHILGISVWQSITTGQGLGLILAEIVDGGWVTFGSRIMKDVSDISDKYKASLIERSFRLSLCLFVGLGLIQFSSLNDKLLVSLSFLCWIIAGIDPHWVSIATGESKYSIRYVVLPRIAGQIAGLIFLVNSKSVYIYLGFQIVFSLAPLLVSIFVLTRGVETTSNSDDLPAGRVAIVLGNITKSSTTWIIIVVGSALHGNSFAGYVAIFRILEILSSISLIINQSNHSIQAEKNRFNQSRRGYLHSIFFSLSIFLISFGMWPIIERIFFANSTGVSILDVLVILSSIPFRTFLTLYTQDCLIRDKNAKTAFLVSGFSPIIFLSLMWVTKNMGTSIGLVPYLFLFSQISIISGLSIVDHRFQEFLGFILGGTLRND